MGKVEQWFYRRLEDVISWTVVLSLIALFVVVLFFILDCLFWLANAHWARSTLCAITNTMSAPKIPRHKTLDQLIAIELDPCDVSTGAKGVDLILNYIVNDVSLFLLVPVASIFSIAIAIWLSMWLNNRWDRRREQERFRRSQALGMPAEVNIVLRNDHQDAIDTGQGVTEFNPEGPAAEKMRRTVSGFIDIKTVSGFIDIITTHDNPKEIQAAAIALASVAGSVAGFASVRGDDGKVRPLEQAHAITLASVARSMADFARSVPGDDGKMRPQELLGSCVDGFQKSAEEHRRNMLGDR